MAQTEQEVPAPDPRGFDEEVFVFPTSFAQQRLWLLDRLEGGGAAYNVPAAVRLTGELDAAALAAALTEVARRHESLRTIFAVREGQPAQVVAPADGVPLTLVDLSGLSGGGREAEASRLSAAEARRAFDLASGPLLRATLLRLSAGEHVALLNMHHIISDAWSRAILIGELGALYAAFSGGSPSPLEELPIQYADYAIWQRDWLRGEALEEQLSYWRRQLEGAPAVTDLPSDRPRPPVQTTNGAILSFTLPAQLSARLQALCLEEGVTPFMLLLAAFKVLLYRYTGQTDLVVGTPIAGRTRAEVEPLIGFFVNTLVLRAELSPEEGFRELLRKVKETCLGAYAHQDIPFEKLVEELRPERSLSHTPLFQIMFTLQNAPRGALDLPGLRLEHFGEDPGVAKFDLTLSMTEGEKALSGSFGYNTDLFDATTIRRMSDNFGVLLAGVAADPSARLSELPLLTDDERRRLLVEFNDTARHYPPGDTIHSLFEQQVRRTPHSVALTFEGEGLSYAELNARANRLAHHLRRRGVGPDSRVAILLERSFGLVVSLLAVLKAGGAYVPLDPQYPRERLSFMLADSGSSLLLTDSALAAAAGRGRGGEALRLDRLSDELAAEADADPRFPVDPAYLAYLIYTSGSTGHPKGVMVTHASSCQLLRWAAEAFTPAELSGVLASTSVCFDLSVFELFAPLAWGGAALLAQDALALGEVAGRGPRAVRLVNTVPSAAAGLLRAGGLPGGVLAVNVA
ncbi:MAG TPA: condensation domain-containing protein, partial [Pyrinomonadaceae bacterium]|nr:condensation domain-containing protein [Pyrinomonadaceae bacterium]